MTHSYDKRLVFAAACLGMLLFGIVFLSLGSVNNMLAARFGLDENAIGTLAALLPGGILLGSLVFGPVVDRFGYRWLLLAAALLVGVALEGMALARSERVIQVCFVLIGIGGGILNGATNALVADISEGDRGANLSLLGVFFGVGALTMPSLLAVLSNHFDLTTIVAGIGAAVLVPAIYYLLITFPPPKQRERPGGWRDSVRLLRDPIFLFAGLALAIQSGMEGMSNDWMTRYFKLVTLGGQASAEWMTQLGLIAVTASMTLTRLGLAGLLRRFDSRIVLFASIAVTAVAQGILITTSSYAAALAAAVLIGAGLAGGLPIVLGYIGDRYPHRSGTAFSTIFVLALAGNMTINKTFGYVASIHGIEQYAMMMLGCLAVSAVLLTLVVLQMRKRRPQPAPEPPNPDPPTPLPA